MCEGGQPVEEGLNTSATAATICRRWHKRVVKSLAPTCGPADEEELTDTISEPHVEMSSSATEAAVQAAERTSCFGRLDACREGYASPSTAEVCSLQASTSSELLQSDNIVFTISHRLDHVHFSEALRYNKVRTLLDVRAPTVTAGAFAMTKRSLSHICRNAGIRQERLQPTYSDADPDAMDWLPLLQAALRFAELPVCLLCDEADPRNGSRRSLGDALHAHGHRIVHITTQGGQVGSCLHASLFVHTGNITQWPPRGWHHQRVRKLSWPAVLEDAALAAGLGRYHLQLPWQTDLLFISDWLSATEADKLKHTIETNVKFHQPTLRFERGGRGVVEATQPRRSAWVCDHFNQPAQIAAAEAAGRSMEPSMLPAQSFEPWSMKVLQDAEAVCASSFNALLLHTYDNGMHSMGFHSDTDEGLGDKAVIASFSLGTTRTFSIRSQAVWQGRRIELQIPMRHGCLIVMGPGFQGRWLHAVLKEPEVSEPRINGTLRFYHLPLGAMLCACGASKRTRASETQPP
eukprot:TRINITY_DN91830_c0_g1_i1.p1 TRINITY_DN91830_c0_g1~~TRINITY_DN91830_c0_g1_i1.p1  ORF type:complete len:519 (+),score=69.13 TRINITY_DN91830_c0_g1_i1:98-1654(+)